MIHRRAVLSLSLTLFAGAAAGAQQTSTPAFPSAPRVLEREVGGNEIAYIDQGRGSTLVLIHGQFGDHLDWDPVLEPLAKRHRVIAVDLPGFGDSDKPEREYTGAFFVDTLSKLLKKLKVKHATFVGNSFGGQIAILYALRNSEQVDRLILVDSGGFREFSEQEKEVTRQRFSETAVRALTPQIQQAMFAPVFARTSEIQRRYLDKQNAKLKRADYPAYARVLPQTTLLSVSTYLLNDLPKLSVPTLLLWGEQDRIVPPQLARKALEQLPRGELKILPACGHSPQLDCPEEFLAAVGEFLESVQNRKPLQ